MASAWVQPKLAVSAPGDAYEQEADRVADAVVAGNADSLGHVSPGLQPKLYRAVMRPEDRFDSIAPAAEESPSAAPDRPSAEVQRSAAGEAPAVTPHFERSLGQAVQTGGEALPASTRSFMENRFDRDLSAVKAHRDPRSEALAEGVQARAFTLGNHIFFARSQYRPESLEGRRLLAHELTHVVQQSSDRLGRQIQRQTSGGGTRCGSYPGYDASVDVQKYNCAGLALRTYKFISPPPPSAVTDAISANFSGASSPGAGSCGAGQVKFWFWQYDLHMEDDQGNVVTPTDQDFHIVGGRVDAKGQDPTNVYTKNGSRPVHGPGTGPGFRPPDRDRATSNDKHEQPASTPGGSPLYKVRSNMSESISCAECLP